MNIPANITFLEEQLSRCEETIRASDPGTSKYETALNCWTSVFCRLRDLAMSRSIPESQESAESPATTAVSLDSDQPSGTLEPGGNEAVEQETQASEPTPAPAAEPGADSDLPTKQEVRSRLAALSAKYEKLNVAEIMSEMGFTRLSDIPAPRYPELLRRVEETVKELD